MKKEFNQFIRESAEQVDVDYNPAHWDKVKDALDKQKFVSQLWKGSALVAIVAISGYLYFGVDQGITSKSTPVTAVPAEKILVNQDNTKAYSTSDKTTEGEKIQQEIGIEVIKPHSDTQVPTSESVKEINSSPITEFPAQQNSPNTHLIAEIESTRQDGCTGTSVQFKSTVNVPATYLWNFGDGKTSTLPNPSHVYHKAGRYGVTLKVTSLLDGASVIAGNNKSIVIHQSPEARFEYDINEGRSFSRTIEFANNSSGTNYQEWQFNGKKHVSKSFSTLVNHKGVYPAVLIVRNEQGCYDTLVQKIVLNQDVNLMAPTAFTPNDDGFNDDFIPELLRDGQVNFLMQIVDSRTGNVIFRTNNRPWNGFNENTGQRALPGTYIWIVTLTGNDNSKEIYKGNLSLLK